MSQKRLYIEAQQSSQNTATFQLQQALITTSMEFAAILVRQSFAVLQSSGLP